MKEEDGEIIWEYKQLDAESILKYLFLLRDRFGTLEGIPFRVWVSPEIERDLKEEYNFVNKIEHYEDKGNRKLHSIDLNIYE